MYIASAPSPGLTSPTILPTGLPAPNLKPRVGSIAESTEKRASEALERGRLFSNSVCSSAAFSKEAALFPGALLGRTVKYEGGRFSMVYFGASPMNPDR